MAIIKFSQDKSTFIHAFISKTKIPQKIILIIFSIMIQLPSGITCCKLICYRHEIYIVLKCSKLYSKPFLLPSYTYSKICSYKSSLRFGTLFLWLRKPFFLAQAFISNCFISFFRKVTETFLFKPLNMSFIWGILRSP